MFVYFSAKPLANIMLLKSFIDSLSSYCLPIIFNASMPLMKVGYYKDFQTVLNLVLSIMKWYAFL